MERRDGQSVEPGCLLSFRTERLRPAGPLARRQVSLDLDRGRIGSLAGVLRSRGDEHVAAAEPRPATRREAGAGRRLGVGTCFVAHAAATPICCSRTRPNRRRSAVARRVRRRGYSGFVEAGVSRTTTVGLRAACGLDVELAERLPQVVLHGASADEQSSGDLSVGLPLRSEASDLIVRRRNLIEALDRGDRLSSLATMQHAEHLEQPISRDVSVARRLLDREDLLQMLDRAVSKRVTMVSAPPGSGKTSLLRAWAARSANVRRVASVSVDRDEKDAQRFWSAVLDAIRSSTRSIDPQTQHAAATAVDADQLVDTVVSELAEQVGPVVLIIDDLHELKSADALAQLERLVAALPSWARVVLSSRRDPAIRLHQLSLPTRSPRSEPAISGSPRARRASCSLGPGSACPRAGWPRCTSARKVGRPACAWR